jgi:iron complex outermembrane receptor protein
MTKPIDLPSTTWRGTTRKKPLSRAVSVAVMASAMSTPALAQTLEEVMVTATKRTESVQDVPLAITALSGEFVNDVNLNDVKDLVQYTPGVTGNSQDSFIDAISVRGIRTQDFGVGGDPSSAFFKNDMYEGRNGSAVTSLYDLNRVEILRGPQGFLFGRSSVGGAFSVHTQRPNLDSTDGYVQLDVAERDHVVGEGAINVPLGDHWATRFAGYYSQEDGFVKNYFPSEDLIEHDKWALRWSTLYERDALSVFTMVEYEDREQSGSVYRAATEGDAWEALEAALGPITVRGSDEDVDVDRVNGDDDNAEILTLQMRIDYDFGNMTLTSNTGYKDHDYYYNEDYDGTPLNLETYRQDQEGDYFQQEFRLTSTTDGPLSWYTGVSYYQEDIESTFTFGVDEDLICSYYAYAYYGYYLDPPQTFSGCQEYFDYFGYEWTPSANGQLIEPGTIDGEYEGWGFYLNLAYSITETFDVEVGVRYTYDEKEVTNTVPTPDSELGAYWAYGFSTDQGGLTYDESWDDWTPRVIARWWPVEDHMLYTSYTAGYKAGGFDSFVVTDNAGEPPPLYTEDALDLNQGSGYKPNTYDPEEVDSFEIGHKGTWLGGTTISDLTVFYYEYTDLQVPVGTDSGATVIKNVGDVEAWGIEFALTAGLGDNWTAYLGAGYLDSEANKLEDACGLEDPTGCEGRRIFWAPEFSGSFVLSMDYPMGNGALIGSYELMWESERGGGWEDYSWTEIDSYEEMNLRVGWASDAGWLVEAYVENLTDEFTWDGMNNLGGKEPDAFFGPRRPRTYGVRMRYDWD